MRSFKLRAAVSLTLILAIPFVSTQSLAGQGSISPPVVLSEPVGAGVYENTDAALVYSGAGWSTADSSLDSGGSHSVSYANGASVALTFTGTRVQWVTRQTQASGINEVYLDGVKVATVDRYSSSSKFQQVLFEQSELSPGVHTILVVGTGEKNAAAAGSSVILDAFIVGDSVPEPVGAGVYENTDAALVYSGAGWSTADSSLDSGGSHSVSYANGASVALTFTGTRVQWVTRQTQASGINEVYLDGVKVATVDRYSSSSKFQQVLFEQSELSPGVHTILVVGTGEKNAAAAGSSVILDAFIVGDSVPEPVGAGVYENTDAALVYSGAGWSTADSSLDSGGSHSVSYANGASVALTFTGTRVQWVTRQTQASGINEVYLDGVKVATVDRYSSSSKFQQVLFEQSELSPGVHTILVVGTGEKNAAAAGSSVILDAFIVGDSVPEPVGAGVYENTDAALVYSGAGWSTADSSLDSGGSHAVSYSNGAAVSLTFDVPENGEVAWISRNTQASGINDVYLNGVKVATVDRYSSNPQFQQIQFQATNLARGTHTIMVQSTGERNPAATGASVILDAFVVIERDPPGAPTGVGSWNDGRSLRLKWTAPVDSDVVGYNIYKSTLGAAPEFISTVPLETETYQDFAVADGVRYTYQVTAVDWFDNESVLSDGAISTKQRAVAYPYRYDSCPAATVMVTTDAELSAAIAGIAPGEVIRLAPGTYKGRHIIEGVAGTHEAPVWVCGPRTAVVRDQEITGGWSFHIENSSHIRLAGFTITNSYGGVMVVGSDNVTIADLHVYNIGQEAIHLRSHTTDSTVIGNLIENTGLVTPQYGEGVYIGSSRANWCTYTACGPDRSDRNQILQNTISGTTAEAIEGKEGTSSGLIEGNVVSGAGVLPISEGKGWIAVQGNGWIIRDNVGNSSPADGIRIMEYVDGWGLGNIVTGNVASDIPGYGVYNHLPRLGTLVTCLNSISGGTAMTNVTSCQK